MRRTLRMTLAALLAAPHAAGAQGSTRDVLDAPRAERQVKVRLEGKTITFAIDGRSDYHELETDQLIVAAPPVMITSPALNPLEVQYTISRTEAADPAHEGLLKLVSGLLQLPGIFDPSKKGDASLQAFSAALREGVRASDPGCAQLQETTRLITDLRTNLFPDAATAASMKKAIEGWRESIRTSPGAQGVAAARATIRRLNDETLKTHVEFASKAIDLLDEKTPAKGRSDPSESTSDRSASMPDRKAVNARLAALEKAIAELQTGRATDCATTANVLLLVAQLTHPRFRLQQLMELTQALDKLHKGLEPFATAANWIPDTDGGERHVNYILHRELRPQADKLQNGTGRRDRGRERS